MIKMNKELINHWESLLQPVFPKGTEFEITPNTSDFRAKVSWKIGTEPDRPNKMSKTIFIIVPDEIADDYSNKNDAKRQSDDIRLYEFVKSNLANHDPDHDNPRDVPPPALEWIAGSEVLNS
jgi:hypothetical protein